MRTRILLADSALLGITFIWGTTFIIVQNTLDKLPPLAFNAWRFLLAALFLIAWQLFFRKRPASTRTPLYSPRMLLTGSLLGIFLFVGYLCQTVGLLYTSASNAAFITGLSVVFVPILSALLLRRRPPLNAVAGVAFSTAGLFFLTTRGTLALNRGDWIVLICALAFAMQIVFTEKWTAEFASLPLTIVQLTTVALLFFLFGAFFDAGKLVNVRLLLEPGVFLVVLFLALAATAIAFLLQTVLQKETPATHVGIIYIMEPVFAAFTSILFQHVTLGIAELSGCALILLGMLLAELRITSK
ncbi:MAG: DMT family transporter [Sporolactobacillus sp.]